MSFFKKRAETIDYDKLAEAIVKAQEIAKSKKADKRKEEAEKRIEKIGLKTEGNKITLLLNQYCVAGKILLFPKKYMVDNMGITLIMATLLSFIFKLIEITLYALPLVLIACKIWCAWDIKIWFIIPIAFFSFFFARLFRMSSIEIGNEVVDKKYIVSIFSSVVAIISLIIALILKK